MIFHRELLSLHKSSVIIPKDRQDGAQSLNSWLSSEGNMQESIKILQVKADGS